MRTFFDVGGRTQEGGDWPDINGTAATLSTVAPRHARPLPDHLLLPCSDQNASNQPGQGTRNISTARYKEVLAGYLEVLAAENTLLHLAQPTHCCSDSGYAIFRQRSLINTLGGGWGQQPVPSSFQPRGPRWRGVDPNERPPDTNIRDEPLLGTR